METVFVIYYQDGKFYKQERIKKNFLRDRRLEVFHRKIDITSIGKEKGLTLEEAGREARYDFYQEVLKKTNSNKIALAHNKDDQIETFMFRLSRGAGLSGLEGIVSKRDNYIRPISEIYKRDILQYLDENGIGYCIDSTNLENEFTRNSIRLDLIPFMEKRYNPKFKDKIFSLIEEIREVNSYLDKEIEFFSNEDILDIEKINKFPKVLRGKILSKYLYKYGIEVNRKKISLIESILTKGGSQEIDLNNDYILRKEYTLLKVEKRKTEIKKYEEIELIIPGKIQFEEYIIEAKEGKRGEKNRDCFYVDLEKGSVLKVRTRRNGDKLVPQGMKGEKKLKDILINEKVPQNKRDSIPLITYNDEIVWIAGIRGNEKYSSNKEHCIKLSIRRKIVER